MVIMAIESDTDRAYITDVYMGDLLELIFPKEKQFKQPVKRSYDVRLTYEKRATVE